ncbi:MAG TPA: CocE/NonD family hydrolase [Thermoanaerobaculia bacterium]|nr:CocE/NonD family hydrolase [Thermoanaerobaculia bacterium]
MARVPPAAAAEPSPARFEVSMEEAWIPMPDGVRLAADLWRPKGARAGERFPVLLEYLPYRKNEDRGERYAQYSYFVRRGYVVARVDIRGTGSSEGTLIPYEYSEIEQRDGEQVIAWLARQPFSTGSVGMFGISWGGFNSIHMAMRNPPALKAIVAVDATDDLYEDDVHFMDGMMHVDSWEMSQDLANAMPAAPDYRIDEKYFRERFDRPPWMLVYKHQQRDGPFWDRTALKTRYDAIRIPTFVVGGWYDGYRDSVPRMLEKLRAPVKAIVGAWDHTFPDEPYPKPGFDFRREMVRWFDRWLKGRDNGIEREPRLAVYVRRWHPPGPYLEVAPGFWRFEDGWPIDRIRERVLFPRPDGSLSPEAPPESASQLRYVPTTGVEAGGPVMWFGDVAPDQRPTDAFSLVYETPPLPEDLEILGLPRAMLRVSADAPLAHWFARINDVAPDGTVTLVANAGQNGAHRESAREPKAIEPGKAFPLEIELHFTSWIFPKGHRIRLSVANAQWPMIWPTPDLMTTELLMGAGATRLLLPVVPPEDRPRPDFAPIPAPGPELPGFGTIDTGTPSGYGEISSVDRNPRTGHATVVATSSSANRYPWGEERHTESITHEAEDSKPESTSVRGEYATEVKLPDRTLRWECVVTMKSDRVNFYYETTRRLRKDGVLVREKTWKETFPRDFQ